jgi:hypothetical protein
MEQLMKEHQWTITDGKFICEECEYIANEEESKFLATSCYSADIEEIYGKIKEPIMKQASNRNRIFLTHKKVTELRKLGWDNCCATLDPESHEVVGRTIGGNMAIAVHDTGHLEIEEGAKGSIFLPMTSPEAALEAANFILERLANHAGWQVPNES